jgi:CBS domain-containing protein
MEQIKISDIMTKRVRSMKAGDSVSAAYELMLKNDLRHVPVVDHHNKIIGIVSDRDILVDATRDIEERVHPSEMLISQIMNSSIVTCLVTDSLRKAIDLMLERKIHSIPIVDGKGILIGLVTSTDVLRLVSECDISAVQSRNLVDEFQKSSADWNAVDGDEFG